MPLKLTKLAKHLVLPMMRSLAILAMLLSQAMSSCAPGTMVVCVHEGGRAHVELVGRECCHDARHAHAESPEEHDDCAVCPGHLAGAQTIESPCDDDSESCTDYPLVISQLRGEHQRGLSLTAEWGFSLATLSDHVHAFAALVGYGHGTTSPRFASPTLAALSTVMLRC